MMQRLTKMQRSILVAMTGDGLAAFNGDGSRKFGFAIFEAKNGGVIVRAFGIPEHFLKARGLIEQCDRNVPGIWYRITAAGRAAVAHGEEQKR